MLAAPLMLALTAAGPADELRFIACPIYRDTDAGRKSGCWLVDEPANGVRYDITSAPTKPDWNHAVLVEGRVGRDPVKPCGGTVLDPVRVSVLDERCPRHMIPAEGFAGRKFGLPVRNVRPLAEARAALSPPYAAKTFVIVYDFDSAFLVYQLSDWLLDQAATYIRAAGPRRIVITGFADTVPAIVSGRRIAERPDIARERAESIRTSLIRLGYPVSQIRVRTATRAQPLTTEATDGLAAPSRRRVEIALTQ